LAGSAVELWQAVLEPAQGDEGLLSADERERASSMKRPRLQARFVSARSILRRILSRYVGAEPASLRFAYGPLGKPSLAHPAGTDLCFSLAHAGALMWVAVAHGARVGVDIERIEERRNMLAIAGRFLHPAEAALLARLPAGDRIAAFYLIWTRREAHAKALGGSVVNSLPDRPVWDPPDDASPALASLRAAARLSGISVWSMDGPEGYAAALAVEGGGPVPALGARQWPPALAI
jgi:4'-phosphopantetheinyl transferase